MNSQFASQQSVDVQQLFTRATIAYSNFCESVHLLILRISLYSPEEIASECNILKNKQANLSSLNQEIFAVITLAGKEIEKEPFVDEYRAAFASATTACDNLYDQLHSLKENLSAPHPITIIEN